MPRPPEFRTAGIGELFRQLRFAPRETRTREMAAAEALLADLEPDRNYPHDFVIFRITGYRPDATDEPVTYVGAALVGDLANLVQRLSEALELPPDHDGRQALALADVARRLVVSTKTLQRYRRHGLVCHYVVPPGGRRRLVCFEDALERFLAGHRAQVDRAARFSRIAADDVDSIVAQARAIRATEGLSLNETALGLSRQHGRAHETIRSLLERHDRRADSSDAIFGEHGPLTERDARVIERATRRGVPTARLAARFGKAPASVRRAANRSRARALASFDLSGIHLPTFDLEEAESVILASPAVTADLDALLPTSDARRFIEAAHACDQPDEGEEHALLAGYGLLKRRARGAIQALPPWPGEVALDAIETDLRWAVMLKRRLVSLAMPFAVERIEQNLHRALVTEPAHRIVDLLALGRDVAARVIETVDPSRGHRLARVVTYAVDRALAASSPDRAAAPRAAARHADRAIPLEDLFVDVVPWERAVRLRRDLLPFVEAIEPASADLIRIHYGLGSTPPLGFVVIAEQQGRAVASVIRLVRGAERALMRRRRSGAG